MISRRNILTGAVTFAATQAQAEDVDTPRDCSLPILGIDYKTPPSQETMDWLLEKAVPRRRFTGLYLTHWNCVSGRVTRDDAWIKQREPLARRGWGFLPIFMGQQPAHNKSNECPGKGDPPRGQGKDDGAWAAGLMEHAGFGKGSVVYLDIDHLTKESSDYIHYLRDWQEKVEVAGYYPGIYCSYLILPWLKRYSEAIWTAELPQLASVEMAEPKVDVFAYDPKNHPNGLIRDGAICTQFLQNQAIPGCPTNEAFDSNRSLVADPSNLPSILEARKLFGSRADRFKQEDQP